MTPANRRTRVPAAATAPVAPAIEASAERAAIERDPASAVDPLVDDAPVIPSADLPAPDAAVLPEPTLTADPGEPMPIVTASPILAVEPGAVDVVKADAAADRVAAGIDPAVDPAGPHAAAAGQPTLTIEGQASHRHGLGDGLSADPESHSGAFLLAELAEFRDSDPEGFALLRSALASEGDAVVLTPDEIVAGLEHLRLTDPIGFDIIRTTIVAIADDLDDRQAPVSTVAVIEVVGPAQGRRRAGRSFGAQPQRFRAGELTDDEIAVLRSDPLLAVGVSEVPADVFGEPLDL